MIISDAHTSPFGLGGLYVVLSMSVVGYAIIVAFPAAGVKVYEYKNSDTNALVRWVGLEAVFKG